MRDKYIIKKSDQCFCVAFDSDNKMIIVGGNVRSRVMMEDSIYRITGIKNVKPKYVSKNKISYSLPIIQLNIRLIKRSMCRILNMSDYVIYSGIKTFGRLMR